MAWTFSSVERSIQLHSDLETFRLATRLRRNTPLAFTLELALELSSTSHTTFDRRTFPLHHLHNGVYTQGRSHFQHATLYNDTNPMFSNLLCLTAVE